jgi:hypothetical protein
VASVIRRRHENKIEDVLGEDQFGFRKGKGIRDVIGMLRMISERTFGTGEEICICFIDWQKAFDCVKCSKLGSRDSAVGIATSYGLDDRGVGVRVPVGSRIFSSPNRSDRL